eukprot:966050-Pelagomonas_calceolata.AAC.1
MGPLRIGACGVQRAGWGQLALPRPPAAQLPHVHARLDDARDRCASMNPSLMLVGVQGEELLVCDACMHILLTHRRGPSGEGGNHHSLPQLPST